MPEPSEAPRRDRVDRLRNREHLIATARQAFAKADETNSPVSLDAIARAAGVGIATLYRHFPTREKLAEAVYMSKLEDLTNTLEQSASDDAAQSLRAWMDRYASFMLSKRGMMDTLRAGWMSGAIARSEAMQHINDVIADFLKRGAADGTLRDDVRADDVTMALAGALTAAASDDAGAQAARLIDLLMAGLRPQP